MAVNQPVGMVPVFRSEMGYPYNYQYHPYTDMEKRQLFLRSYQFSTRKKKSIVQRIRRSFFRVRRVIWVRFRSARKIRKIIWFRLKYALFSVSRKSRFLRLNNPKPNPNLIRSWSPSFFS